MIAALLVLLVGWVAAVPLQDESLVTTVSGSEDTTLPSTFAPSTTPALDLKKDRPEVYSLHVTSHIQFRYASTIVSSRVANVANSSREVVFSVTLPDTAFISGFLMEIDGKVYKASVKEKEAAKKEYDEAIKGGLTAGHVAQSSRNSNRFTVSVNVESLKKVTFNLTYEELLKRELSAYTHVINLDPGQIVRDLSIDVNINESSPLKNLVVTKLKESNEIEFEKSAANPLAVIKRPSNNSAIIRWAPSIDDQRKLNEEGVKGQLAVRYDVDRTEHPEQILVNEGYFVHFFSPSDLPTLRKHVTFVMDVSGSMAGRKIEQLREAMKIILDDLNPGDFFSLVIFSTDVQVWDPDHELVVPQSWNSWRSDVNSTDSPLRNAAVVPATPENVKKAQDYVKNLQSYYSTNIYGALLKGLELAKLGKNLTGPDENENKPEPIIIFLTDGEANVGESDPEKIVGIVTDKNGAEGVTIFALAFGDYANSQFLKKLSLRNFGFARKIYEASDSALQLRDFYRLVSSPLLARVSFNYVDGQVEEGSLSRTNFSTFFSGSELVVTGKLKSSQLTGHLTAKTSNGTTSITFAPQENVPFPDWELAAFHRPERNYSDASFMERLWAYLTIQQLLEKESVEASEGSNVTLPSKQKALDLALKYGFVTPVTSLVVVKPNETVSAEPEKGDVSGGSKGSYGGHHQKLHYLISPQPAFAGSGFAAMHLQGIAPPSAVVLEDAVEFLTTEMYESSSETTLESSTLTADAALIPVHNLMWLASVSNASHVTLRPNSSTEAETFELGLNKRDEAFSVCTSPQGDGHCRYLPHCALDIFAVNMDEYYPFFCRINNYAGVCCPDSIKPISPAS